MEATKQTHRCLVRRMDQSGDSIIATYDPVIPSTCEVAQQELTDFLNDCVKRHGKHPPVWARRAGEEFRPFNPKKDLIGDVEEVLTGYPLVGG